MGWQFVGSSAVAAPGHTFAVLMPFEEAGIHQERWQEMVLGNFQVSVFGVIRYETVFQAFMVRRGFGFVYDPADTLTKDTKSFSVSDAQGYNYAR